MFARGIIVLLCVLVAISDGARAPTCNYLPNACPKNYEPVCGTDGVTYGNECMLCAEIEKSKTNILIKKDGPC